MATINLGSIKFNWKGAFNNSTAYAVDDVVSSGGNSYVCIQASQGNAVGNATAYWNIMSSAGTNGTNGTDLSSLLSTRGDLVFKNASALARLAKGTAGQVLGQGANDPAWINGSSSTLTTQGDILYRDGSGLQRLAKGTAGQVLQMNSAANAPEYADASGGGLIHIKTQVVTSSVTDVAFVHGSNGVIFDGTYKRYKVIYDNLRVSGSGIRCGIQFRVGSSFGSGNYNWGSSGSQNGSVHTGGSTNDTRISLSARNASHATQANTVGEFILSDPADTARYKVLAGYSGGFGGNGAGENYQVGGASTVNSSAINGFRFIPYSGTIVSLTATLFGVAQS